MHGIREGRVAAEEIDRFLMGDTRLAHQGGIPLRSWLPPPVTEKHACNGNGHVHVDDEADVKTEVGEEEEKPWVNGTEVAVEA